MLLKKLLVVLIVGVTVCRAIIDNSNSSGWENNDTDDDWDDDEDDENNFWPDFESLHDEAEDTEEYWQDWYWELPDDGRECSEGQEMGADGTCVECPVGYYNQDWFRVDVCMACEIGSFMNYTGATECDWCPGETTTFWTGSTNSSDCMDKSVRLEKAYLTTVKAWVSVTGDLCNQISDLLYGISALQFYEASFTQCDYDEESDISSMALKISPPTRYGMDVYYGFSIVEAHREMLNAYISLGQHYAEKAFDFLSNSMVLDWFGLDMDIDQLNVEDFRIVSFNAAFEDRCSSGYSAMDNGMCVESSDAVSTSAAMPFYLSYFINMDVCADNVGQTMARNFIEEWGISNFLSYSCLMDGSCSTEFMFCESLSSDASTDGSSGSYLVMKLDVYSSDAMEDYPFSADWDISSVAENVTVTYVGTAEGCSSGVEFSSNFSAVCLDSCDAGQYLDAAGFCVNCPFTTWSNDSESCNSCPWYTETPFWGMDSEDMCIETENWWRDDNNGEWLRDLGGRLDFDLALEPRIDFCRIATAKQSLDGWCSSDASGFADELDDSEDDVEIDSAQEFVCYFSNRFGFYYGELCGDDFDMSWDDAWNALDFDEGETIEDLICVVIKPLYDMEGDTDLSDDCAWVDNNVLDMPFEFDGEIDTDGASILVPMLTAMKKLETMSFDSFAKAGEQFMERFGMYDMNALTGLDIANDLRDFAAAVPEGLSMEQFDFDVSYNEDEFFCDNGAVLRDCEHEWCDDWSCSKKDSDWDKDIYCRHDACDNCAQMWFYHNDTTDAEHEFECATCDFPDSIDNGYKIQSWSTSGNSAYYACNPGYKLKDCNNYAWCDINTPDEMELPECEENTCQFNETIENGYLVEQWSSDDYWDSCPWARYLCNPGWEIEGDNYMRCYSADDMWAPTCVEGCSFPLYIENGVNIENYTTWNGKWYGKYECIDGYFPTGEASCSEWQETEDGSWEESMFIPECVMEASCEFPQEANGGYLDYQSTDESSGQKYGQYYCYNGSRAEGPTWVECEGENRDEANLEFLCIDEDEYCYYNWGAVENGWVYRGDNNAIWFQCGDSYELVGEERARCEDGEAIYPECVYREPECDLPDWIDNGWVSEDHGDSKKYDCNEWDGWMMPSEDGWAWCNGTEVVNFEECVRFNCSFDQYIDNGNLSSVSDNGIHAWYYCYDGYRFRDEDSGASCDADGNYEYPECMENGDPCDWPDTIDNGNLVQESDFTAMYNCSEGYIMEGSWWASCYDGEISYMPECKEYHECDFPDIENGWLADEWGSGGRYECDDGYRCKDWNCYSWCDTDTGDLHNEVECEYEDDDEYECDFPDIENGWLAEEWGSGGRYECMDEYWCSDGNCYAECDTSTGDLNYIPECENDDTGDSCDWPAIENGWMSDEWDGGAKYECNDGYQMSGSNVVYCNASEGWMGDLPECYWDDGGDGGECMFPSYIEKGYMYWEGDWQDDGVKLAAYRCYSPYVMQNIEVDAGKSYVEMYGIAVCYEDDSGNKQTIMPWCEDWEDVGHCGLPKEIENGEASNMTWWEGGWWAEYYCHDGYMMMETWMDYGNWGWCRGDGSMNIPRCVSSEEYWNIEFMLNANGYSGIDNGGYVMAKYSNSDWESDWELGCDDGVNDNAAGAVCRSLGWNHGKKITPNKKMKALEDYDFGWININCDYDDGLMTSESCEAARYGDDTALCSSSEQWAVQCYDTKWGIDSSLTVNSKNGKMVCNMEMWKEDSLVSAKGMDFWVEFGARNGTDHVSFDVSSKDKASSKGFKSTAKAKSEVKNSGYSCFYCKAGTGDMDLGFAWDGDC